MEKVLKNIKNDKQTNGLNTEKELTVQRIKEGIPSSSDVEKACGILRLLSDPTRMKILLALMRGEMCVYTLAEVSNNTVSGVSHQLRVLRDNKIVKAKRFGKNVEYSITDFHVSQLVESALEYLCAQI